MGIGNRGTHMRRDHHHHQKFLNKSGCFLPFSLLFCVLYWIDWLTYEMIKKQPNQTTFDCVDWILRNEKNVHTQITYKYRRNTYNLSWVIYYYYMHVCVYICIKYLKMIRRIWGWWWWSVVVVDFLVCPVILCCNWLFDCCLCCCVLCADLIIHDNDHHHQHCRHIIINKMIIRMTERQKGPTTDKLLKLKLVHILITWEKN